MKTSISLDLKKNRIRIHKQTLKLLNDPAYVHFMVNPKLGNIAIAPCLEDAVDALKISYGTGIECEIYSKSFTELLSKLNPNIEPSKTYQLPGIIGISNKLIIFSIKDIIPVNSQNMVERRSKNE